MTNFKYTSQNLQNKNLAELLTIYNSLTVNPVICFRSEIQAKRAIFTIQSKG